MIDANVGGSMGRRTSIESEIVHSLGGGSVPELPAAQNNITFGSKISQLNKLMDDLSREEGEVKEQLQWLELRGKKRKRQVDVWLQKVQNLKNEVIGSSGQDMEPLTEKARKCREKKPLVLSTDLVGQDFERNVRKLWELLRDDGVSIISIHGIGGVGKTCLATHMENEIRRKGVFNHVFWVTVSQDCNIFKLQHALAERLGLKLHGDDVRGRASILSSALETSEKSVIILDDIWKYVDLEKVGVPFRVKGIKLIFTSRLEHVCAQMDCPADNMIRMNPLSHDEGRELFFLKLGCNGVPATLPPDVIDIANSIIQECGGLPLVISVMARTMKGVKGVYQWRHSLNKLKNLEMGEEMEEEVLKVLKLSYDHLERGMQNCFLHCALLLYKKTHMVDLISKLLASGMIKGTRSLREAFDEGRTMLDQIKGHSLLSWNDSFLYVHPIVGNMACHIIEENHRYMVRCDKRLKKIPQMQDWTVDLELVSLEGNAIKEIPEGTSPYCPKLSTLLLSHNHISSIPRCFFEQMNALALLDLSYNSELTSLPDSLCSLRSLTSLLLRCCNGLEHVPPLGALQALSRLVISNTRVNEVQGLEMLTNLKWLDLSFNSGLMLMLGSVLSSLTKLQYLDFRGSDSVGVKVEDLQGMSMLECLGSSFEDCEAFSNYVQMTQNTVCGPKAYHLMSGNVVFDMCWYFLCNYHNLDIVEDCRMVTLGNCEESPHQHLLPTDLAELQIADNNHWKCLCDALTSNDPFSLRKIKISFCEKLESLFCLSNNCSFCTNLENFESLVLFEVENLTVIRKEDIDRTQPSLSPNGVFAQLKHLDISGCHKIERLLMPGLLSELQNLETIRVTMCDSLREIFAVSSSDSDGDGDDGASSITLRKLTELELDELPLLETVCKGTILCESLPTWAALNCPNLETDPKFQIL